MKGNNSHASQNVFARITATEKQAPEMLWDAYKSI